MYVVWRPTNTDTITVFVCLHIALLFICCLLQQILIKVLVFRNLHEIRKDPESRNYHGVFWYFLGPKGCTNAIPVGICRAVDLVCGAKSIYSSKGRGRLLFRCALNGQWIHILLEILQIWTDICGYYTDQSLIRSSSCFTQALVKLKSLPKFKLDLDNFAFLDTTWERPIFW